MSEDATVESLSHTLAHQPFGLVHAPDEGSGFLGSMTRYSTSSDRPFWLQAFEAQPSTVSRRKLGDVPLFIQTLGISVVTGAQPVVARELFAGPADGLAERFVVAWPDYAPAVDPDDAALHRYDEHQRDLTEALRRLHDFRLSGPHVLRLDAAAQRRFFDWRGDYLDRLRARCGDEIPGWAAKAPGIALRIALVIALLDAAHAGPVQVDRVSVGTIDRAISVIRYFVAHRRRAERDAQEPDAERKGRALARWVVESGTDVIDVQSLRRQVKIPGLRHAEDLRIALLELAAARWLSPGSTIPDRRGSPLPAVVSIKPQIIDRLRSSRGHGSGHQH